MCADSKVLTAKKTHDFTEAPQVEQQKEVQSTHFGGNVSDLIEGCTVHFPSPNDETEILFDFHSFLPGDLQQMACTACNHMKKLVKNLKGSTTLKDGGRIFGSAGCAKQHKCSTAIRFMSHLSFQESIAMGSVKWMQPMEWARTQFTERQ